MKCRYCGHEIPDGVLYCENCGKEVRIVPDYNPLDDILAQEIVGSINGEPTGLDLSDTERLRRTASQRRTTGRTIRGTGAMTEDREARRRQAQRRKAQLRKKRRILLAVIFLILAALIGCMVLIYKNSYNGIVSAGNKALERQEYTEASDAFRRAINKKKERPEAYTGLSRVYLAQNDPDAAESVFLDAIEEQAGNSDLYGACIDFYIDTKQQMEIPGLLDEATDQVREALSEYIIDVPEFSLDAKETYEEVQQLTLTAGKGLTIYYTVDGSDPDTGSTKYTEPIQLDEGETTVTAIAVNKKGIPSMPEAKEYVIELPIEDAPAVSPSTGQYEAATSIEVKVPDGYEAYYTTDGSDPTTASAKYTGPVNMPEGETLFKAVLVSGDGRLSGITTRNYVLELPSDSSE